MSGLKILAVERFFLQKLSAGRVFYIKVDSLWVNKVSINHKISGHF